MGSAIDTVVQHGTIATIHTGSHWHRNGTASAIALASGPADTPGRSKDSGHTDTPIQSVACETVAGGDSAPCTYDICFHHLDMALGTMASIMVNRFLHPQRIHISGTMAYLQALLCRMRWNIIVMDALPERAIGMRDEDASKDTCPKVQDAQWTGGGTNADSCQPDSTGRRLHRLCRTVHTPISIPALVHITFGI